VFEFGHGMHYTDFEFSWVETGNLTFNIQQLISQATTSGVKYPDTVAFASFDVNIQNVGSVESDYVALLFLSGTAGPEPAPNKSLISYDRVHSIPPGVTSIAKLPVVLSAVTRIDEDGNAVLFPGTYSVTLDVVNGITATLTLTGEQAQLIEWPQPTGASGS
jgi:xylan 1,4-beta-xylosidase